MNAVQNFNKEDLLSLKVYSDLTDRDAEIAEQFAECERCLNKTCDQMEKVLVKVDEVKTRLCRARRAESSAAAVSLQMQLQVLQGMYTALHGLGAKQGDQLQQLAAERSRLAARNPPPPTPGSPAHSGRHM